MFRAWVLFITCCVLSALASWSFIYYWFLGFLWFLVLLRRFGIFTYTLFWGVCLFVCCGADAWLCCQLDECDLFYFRLCVLWEKCAENWGFVNFVAVFYFLFLTDNVLHLKFYGSVLVCIFVCLVYNMSINFIEVLMCVVCLQFWFCSVALVDCMCSSNIVENILLLDPTKN
jgi:hypothetical protein